VVFHQQLKGSFARSDCPADRPGQEQEKIVIAGERSKIAKPIILTNVYRLECSPEILAKIPAKTQPDNFHAVFIDAVRCSWFNGSVVDSSLDSRSFGVG
jgi:hypothetical protein